MEGSAGLLRHRLHALESCLRHTPFRKSTSDHAVALCDRKSMLLTARRWIDSSVKIDNSKLKNGSFVKDLSRQSVFRSHQQTRLQSAGVSFPVNFADGALTSLPAVGPDLDSTGAPDGLSELLFVGSGTSEGIPRVSCLTDPAATCPVCFAATQPGNRNRRRNTGLLIKYQPLHGDAKSICIDVGKFFYHSALQWFPPNSIRQLDGVIITHAHADAIGGLDDLRDWTNNVQDSIPIYVTHRDLQVMGKSHYYLVDPSGITAGTAVSTLDFKTIDTSTPFRVARLHVTPLPVWHGDGYLSLGFRFGKVCYISDVSAIPDSTYPLLEDCDLLILDALQPGSSTSSHFGLDRAMEEVRKIKPRRTLFTGMNHRMDHEKVETELRELENTEGIHVGLSYDGMVVKVRLHE